MPADPNRVILTGENPFIRLSQTDGGPNTTNASFWRIITCPAGPGHVQRRDGRHRDPGAGCPVQQIGRPALFLDGASSIARRANRADLVSDRRSVADPHAAQCGARASLRGVHFADPGAGRPADAKRRASGRAAMAARARRQTLQHLRIGVLRKLDGSPISAPLSHGSPVEERDTHFAKQGAPLFFAVFAVFAGNYQRLVTPSPQESRSSCALASDRTAR